VSPKSAGPDDGAADHSFRDGCRDLDHRGFPARHPSPAPGVGL